MALNRVVGAVVVYKTDYETLDLTGSKARSFVLSKRKLHCYMPAYLFTSMSLIPVYFRSNGLTDRYTCTSQTTIKKPNFTVTHDVVCNVL